MIFTQLFLKKRLKINVENIKVNHNALKFFFFFLKNLELSALHDKGLICFYFIHLNSLKILIPKTYLGTSFSQ